MAGGTLDIPGFQNLSTGISIWRPPLDTAHAPVSPPVSLIIFCSWLGAAPKHIAKYTAEYNAQFPHAEILLIQSRLQTMLRGGLDLTAACSIIARHLDSLAEDQHSTRSASRKVLWHACSNGGAMTATALLSTLRQQLPAFKLPAHAATLVLDCTPGKPGLASTVRAVVLQLPRSTAVTRWLVTAAVYTASILYMIIYLVTRRVSPLDQSRQTLNDPDYFPPDAARLYLYSKADELIAWRDVHEHVDAAKRKGYRNVKEEVFESAPHCRLVAEDAARYWAAVREVVNR